MAGGKKARAKLKSERLKNRMRAGNGSDPSPPGGVGSSRTPRSALDQVMGGSAGMSLDEIGKSMISMRELMMVPTGTGNGDTLADAWDRALGDESGPVVQRLRDNLGGVLGPLLCGGTPDDIEGELGDLFRSLQPETQNVLVELAERGKSLGKFPEEKDHLASLRADAFRCLDFESRAVGKAVKELMQKAVLPGYDNGTPANMRAELLKVLAEAEAIPETVRAFEALLDAMDSAVEDDDDDSSGPPSLAQSDDDDDETRRRSPPSIRVLDDDDSSGPPSLASSSGSDDDEDETENARTNDQTPASSSEDNLPAEEAEKGKGSVGTGSESSSQPPSLASSPESSPAVSPRASRVPSEAHIAGGSGRGTGTRTGTRTGPVDPKASPSEALNAFFDPGEAKKKEAANGADAKKSIDAKNKPSTSNRRAANTTTKNKERVDDPTPSPVPETQKKPNTGEKHKRFSDKVTLARKLARASVAKALEAMTARNAKNDADGDNASTSAAAVSRLDTVSTASREAQFAYFRARREARDEDDDDSPWIRLRRVRRVREELSGRLGIDGSVPLQTETADEKEKESVVTSVASLCDALARRCVDDATFLEWLLQEPYTTREWRYENTVRTCEFHNQPLRESFSGNGDAFNKSGPGLSRCYEFAPEVSGAARHGPRCARSLGRCFEVSCAAGHKDVVVHARCWHRNCVEKDEDLVYGPLLARLETEEGVDPDAFGSSDGELCEIVQDGLVERQRASNTFETFVTTEEPAFDARQRACAMWVTKFPTCPVAGCDARVCKATYFSDAADVKSTDAYDGTSFWADCDEWHEFFGAELTRTFGGTEDEPRDYDPERIACMLGGDERTKNSKNLETVVDFVIAREELTQSEWRSERFAVDDSDLNLPTLVSEMFETARDVDTTDRDGAGVVSFAADLTGHQLDILNGVFGVRQGRVRNDGRIAASPVAPDTRFNLLTSPNPFYVDETNRKLTGYENGFVAGALLALASRAFDESPGHQLPDESHLAKFRFDGDLSDLGDSLASRFVSVRNPHDDEPPSRVALNFKTARGPLDNPLRAPTYARDSDRAFKRFCEVYFDALHEALRETRRCEEATAREILRRVQGKYDAMRAIREAAYDKVTHRDRAASYHPYVANSAASQLKQQKGKARACAVSYPEVDAVAEANQRDFLEEEEREARRAFYEARRVARAAEAKREKQRLKKKARKKREQEEKEEERARQQAELDKKEEEKKRQQAEALARKRREAEEAEQKEDARRKAEEKAKKAKEAKEALRAAREGEERTGSSSGVPSSSSSAAVPTVSTDADANVARVPLRVFLTYVMRNHSVVERWRTNPNPGCVSCGARIPSTHRETCAIPAAECDVSAPNDALRVLQAAEDTLSSTPFADDALERAFAGLAAPSGEAPGHFFGVSATDSVRAWTPPPPAPPPPPPAAPVQVPPAVSATSPSVEAPPSAWTNFRDHLGNRARSGLSRRHGPSQPAPVPTAFADGGASAGAAENSEEEAMCCICLETTMDEDDLAASAKRECGCGQLVHLLCLKAWHNTQSVPNCPGCRKELPD